MSLAKMRPHGADIRRILVLCRIAVALLVALQVPAALAAGPYYVDPLNGNDSNNGLSPSLAFKTIGMAKSIVELSTASMTANIYVYLRGGRYFLSAPLNFGPSDGGSSGYSVVYQGYSGESPVISGGMSLTGTWSGPDSMGIYSATVPIGTKSRNLYVNGAPAVLARSTGVLPGFVTSSTTMTTSQTAIATWRNPTQIEFVWPFSWKTRIVTASNISVSGATAILTMQQPAWSWSTQGNGATSSSTYANPDANSMFYQNAYELLDQPGEFYVDPTAGKAYYIPRPGESMATADTILGYIDGAIVTVNGGSSATPVQNLMFRNVSFQHSTFLRAGTTLGQVGEQSNSFDYVSGGTKGYNTPPAGLQVTYATGFNCTDCSFQNLGTSGVWLGLGTQNSTIARSIVTAVDLNGIQLGDVDSLANNNNNVSASAPTGDIVLNNVVKDNYIYNIGLGAPTSSQAIFAAFFKNTTIINNRAERLGYTGIATGYEWDSNPTLTGGNSISNNYVSNFMNSGVDGGGYYNLGNVNGSVWNGNYIADDHNVYGALYLDEGTSYGSWTNNVVERAAADWLVEQSSDLSNTKNGNYNDGEGAVIGSDSAPTNTTTFAVSNEPAGAIAIISAAGLEPQNRYLSNQLGLANGQIIADTFASGLTGSWSYGSYWSVIGGYLQRAAQPYSSYATIGEMSLADYTVSANVTLTDSSSEGAVLARFQDNSDTYLLQLAGDTELLQILKNSGGTSTTLASMSYSTAVGGAYNLALKVQGSQLSAYVNGSTTPQLTATDSTFTNGRAGVRGRTGLTQFSNFAVAQNLTFADNFDENNISNWSPNSAWAMVANGSGYAVSNSSYYESLLTNSTSVANGSIQAQLDPSSSTCYPGLVVRYQDSQNFYLLMLSYPTQQILLIRKQNGASYTLDSAPISLTPGVWRTVSLRMNGSVLQGFIDGVNGPVVEAAGDTTFATGGVGLRNARAATAFDNVFVYQQ